MIIKRVATLVIISSLSVCLIGKTVQATEATMPTTTAPPITKTLEPVVGLSPAMTDLVQLRRSEINTIQYLLKPQYRERLKYTFDSAGIFVVVLPEMYGKERLFLHMLNSCRTPPVDLAAGSLGKRCLHECGMVFNEQSWEAAPVTGDWGRCLDNAAIWLHPRKPLPDFTAIPLVGN